MVQRENNEHNKFSTYLPPEALSFVLRTNVILNHRYNINMKVSRQYRILLDIIHGCCCFLYSTNVILRCFA